MTTSTEHEDILVETNWVAAFQNDPGVRIIEADEDVLLYATGHIPGAVQVDWFTTLQHPVIRDFLTQADFEALCSRLGITRDMTVVFYGDKNNWFACYSFWLFDLFGHKKLHIMNGGRNKWVLENRPLTKEVPSYRAAVYKASPPRRDIRAFREDVLHHINRKLPLVDVRSPQEFTGELIAMPGYPQEGAQRGGHILGAVNIPWDRSTNPETGTFKPISELRNMFESRGIFSSQEIITYCRIGERSSHTWFVLKYLLDYPRVKNYDGSWTEWGNLVGAPIEKGPGEG